MARLSAFQETSSPNAQLQCQSNHAHGDTGDQFLPQSYMPAAAIKSSEPNEQVAPHSTEDRIVRKTAGKSGLH